ncbi:MAG: DUF3493 domain-containing protein [Synechocystis sp.]|jgi:hypothetical protein
MTFPNPKLSPEKYDRLKAEATAPYRSLRKFIYLGFGASGLIGLFIFSLKLIAGRAPETVLPNLALQMGVVALMVVLFRWDSRHE